MLAAGGRVSKPEPIGVQSLPGKVGKDGRGASAATAIGGVADQRMTDMGKVHPDLMRSSGFQPAVDQAGDRAQDPCLQLVVSSRRLAARGNHRHLLPVPRVASDVAFDPALGRTRHPPDHCLVGPIDRAVGELPGKAGQDGLGLGGDHQARSVLVQPVDDPRSSLAADAGKALAAMGDQRIHQCAVRIAGGGVDDQAGRFVDHDQILVLEDDFQRHRLRRGRSVGRLGKDDGENLARPGLVRGLCRSSPDRDLSRLDQSLDSASRKLRQPACQRAVDAFAGLDRLERAGENAVLTLDA